MYVVSDIIISYYVPVIHTASYSLFSLNHQCFQLLMRDQAHSIYSTFVIRVALLYLFVESWNCWIFTSFRWL